MTSTFGINNLTVEPYGNVTTIPDNIVAKLMYYLDCVSNIVQYDDNTFTDYQNYDKLNEEEIAAVFALAIVLHPQLFIDAKIFIVNPDLLIDAGNQFYKITDETIGVHVNQEIMIGGRTVKVLNVMACNENWLTKYYYTPINAVNRMISEKKYNNSVVNTGTTFIQKPINNAPLTPKNPIIAQKFKEESVLTTCRFCGSIVKTKIEYKINCVACFCCLLFNIFFTCAQICLDKSICCCDVIHKCPNCWKILGEYSSC